MDIDYKRLKKLNIDQSLLIDYKRLQKLDIDYIHYSLLDPWMNLGKTEWWKVGKWQVIIQWKGSIGYKGLTDNIYLSVIALSRMTLAKHTKVAINMNIAWVQTWDGDFWYRKTGQFSPCEEKLGIMPKPMVKCQVHSVLSHIHMNLYTLKDTTHYLSNKQTTNFWSPKKWTIVVYVWLCVVFCCLSVNFVVYVQLL